MKEVVYGVYSADNDITFVMVDVWEGNEIISTEVTGFYFGEPSKESTKYFNGKTKAIF